MALIFYSTFFLSLFLIIYFVSLFNPNLIYLPKQFHLSAFAHGLCGMTPLFHRTHPAESSQIGHDVSFSLDIFVCLQQPGSAVMSLEQSSSVLHSTLFEILSIIVTALVWYSLDCITLQCYINVSLFFLLQIPCGQRIFFLHFISKIFYFFSYNEQ